MDYMYSPPGTVTVNSTDGLLSYNVTECGIEVNGTFKSCSRWVYDTSIFSATIISKFDIVCSDRLSRAHFLTSHFIGLMTASILCGVCSDILGRKPVMFGGIIMLLISMGLRPFLPTFTLVTIFEFLNGAGSMISYLCPFIILTEIVGPDKRVLANFSVYFIFCVGNYLLLLLAYFLRDWKELFWSITVFIGIYTFVMFFVPESPRWLLSRNRKTEAIRILEKMAAVNGNKMAIPVDDMEFKKENSSSFLQFIKTMSKSKRLMLRLAVVTLNWFAISMTYYGISMNVAKFSGNVFANFAASSTSEVLAVCVCWLVGDRFSRRRFFTVNMLLGGVVCICTIFTQLYADESLTWLTTALAVCGKFFNSITFFVVYMLTAELFPTVLRASVIGVASMSGRIGSISSAYVGELGDLIESRFGIALPLIILGGTAIVAGTLSMFLPDSTNILLPESIQDAEDISRFDKKQHKDEAKRHELQALNEKL